MRHHHERVDGNGYPDGLLSEAIPLLSRIIAVADAYNAMTSDRPYRSAMPSSIARMRLARSVGTQFDATAVAAFEAILETAPTSYSSGEFRDNTNANCFDQERVLLFRSEESTWCGIARAAS